MSGYIRNPGAAYRSTNPAHLDLVRADEQRRSDALAAAQAVADELVPGSAPYGHSNGSGAFSTRGLLVEHGAVDVPVGMRWDTKARRGARVLVPRMRTDEGKAIAKRLRPLFYNPSDLGAVSSIVCITDGDLKWFSMAVIEVIDDQVFATYHHPLEATSRGNNPSDRERVESDPGWQPIPLSELYAAREAAGVHL